MGDSKNTYKVAVVGASGYAGLELIRWLLGHPVFDLVLVTSDSDSGKPVAEVFPQFIGLTELKFCPHSAVYDINDGNGKTKKFDLVFLAVPHTAALVTARKLIDAGVSVVDLSADFRLKNPAEYQQWYGTTHTAIDLLKQAQYGLPELFAKEIQTLAKKRNQGNAQLIANPGCYPTATILACAPAIALLADNGLVVVYAISGVSGAGRGASLAKLFCTVSEDLVAYGATIHRHTPEIAQLLAIVAGCKVNVVFTPHLSPLIRGMVSTVVIPIKSDVNREQCLAAYESWYQEKHFVQFLGFDNMPHSANVRGSNYAQVGIAFDENAHALVASCAIDNLGKGAAGQAIQNANILFGLQENTGLDLIAPAL